MRQGKDHWQTPFKQVRPAPQGVPSGWPEQEMQPPAEQKRPVPQTVPSATGVVLAVQTGLPETSQV